MEALIDKPIISADSHITEPPSLYKDRVPKKFVDSAPRLVRTEQGGDVVIVDGMPDPFPITLASGAGLRGQALAERANTPFDQCFAGGWDSKQRLLDQDLDGIYGEVIYPSLGMYLCNHPDVAYKTAMFDAYNEWLAEYCSLNTSRLIGLGQTAIETPEQGIKDLEQIKKMGLKGVMMPGYPTLEDYDSPIYDDFWAAATELDLPLSFHILTYKDGLGKARGPKVNAFMSIIRGNQDIIGTMIFSGVFERHPGLKVVCAEADAGWVPHYMYRMDHALERNPWTAGKSTLAQSPSHYFRENIYLTFQDDLIALKLKDFFNKERMMWASDFPHLDSTYPDSHKLLAEQTADLTKQEKTWLLHDNVATLYGLS
jgi:predicted TIM-barrel fold metal-dependent hydrolase